MADEMLKLEEEIKKCEVKAKSAPPIKDLYLREQETLKRDHERLSAELRALRVKLSESKGMLSEYKQKSQDMYMVLGQMKATVQLDTKLAANNEVIAKLLKLDDEIRVLQQRVKDATEKYKEDISWIWTEICDRTLHYLQYTKAEERYKKFAPEFDKSELSLKVHDANGETHGMAVLGSGSNWVGYHVAFMTAFHEHFANKENGIVPSFCVFDQPSQVHGAEQQQDIEAVRGIISAMAAGVKNTKGSWQAILVEHATKEAYEGVDGVAEIENWWGGTKLIPPTWIANEERVAK